jgi:carnitine O-acetyltransferase
MLTLYRYIRWTITSTRGDAGQLRHYLAEAATELRDMMERGVTQEKKEMGMEGKTKL